MIRAVERFAHGIRNAAQEGDPQMSVVVPFPGARAAARGTAQRSRAQSAHSERALSVISWVRPTACDCCGRPTLAGESRVTRETLCGHCSPPSIA